MAATAGAERMGDAYFGFYLLAMGRGRARTVAELGTLLQTAGFESIKCASPYIELHAQVITARTSSRL